MTLLLTVLRGLRSRALLSVGTVMLTALAVGAAVLGPVFAEAVTNSFLISRLGDAPNPLTGVSWRFSPDAVVDARPAGAQRAAQADAVAAAEASAPDLFAAPQTYLETQRVEAFGGLTRLAAKEGACQHLEIDGDCPSRPGEVMLLEGDLEFTGAQFGDEVDLAELGRVVIVGSYRAPGPDDVDFWFNDQRFVSIPPAGDGNIPYQPAPWLTVPEAFDTLPNTLWSVLVDRRLTVPADLTLQDLEVAAATAASVTEEPRSVEGGTLRGQPFNDVSGVIREVQGQQETARNSIAPAVLSLVLVALALLLRLLMAAADLRLPELALASLRGLNRRRMWQLGLSEPTTLLVISVPLGAAVGLAMSVGLVRWWLIPDLPVPLPAVAIITGATVVLATAVVAVLAVGLVLRVTLSDQLTGVRRPRRTSRAGVVLQLVLVATALAVLASKLSAGAPGDPDITDLVLPVLLAVVAGLGATRLTAAAASWWTRRRRRSRSLPSFVAARAISRRQEGTLVVLPVTAAIAICVFGAGVYDSASQWRTSVAATIAPAQVVWRSPLPMAGTVDLTHDVDPDGEYLMAATTIVTQGPSFTIADTPRLTRVAAWQPQWTPGVGTQEITDALIPRATVPLVRGERVGLTLARDTIPFGETLTVELRLDAPDGEVHSAFVGPFEQGTSTAETETPYCKRGCRLTAITIGGPASVPVAMEGDLRLSALTADGQPVAGAVEGAGWQAAPRASAEDGLTGVSTEDGAIEVTVDSPDKRIIAQLVSGGLPPALPVVKGVDARTTAQGGAALAQSSDFPVDPVVVARSVPLLGPNGLLIDYETVTIGRQIFEQQSSPVLVLARSDTPESMIEELQARGMTLGTTLAAERRTLDQSAYALALRLYAVVAALVLLMALAGLFVSTAVQLPARRRDAASLRVVGVPRRSVMSAVLRELAFVLGSTALAGLAAGTLAQYVVLRTVTLGYVEKLTTPALVAAIDPARLAVLAALAALLFGGIAVLSSALTVRGARGATLRESAR